MRSQLCYLTVLKNNKTRVQFIYTEQSTVCTLDGLGANPDGFDGLFFITTMLTLDGNLDAVHAGRNQNS